MDDDQLRVGGHDGETAAHRFLTGVSADHHGDRRPAQPPQDAPGVLDVRCRGRDHDAVDPRVPCEVSDGGDEDGRPGQGQKLLRGPPAETGADAAGRDDHGHVTHYAVPSRLRRADA